MSVARVKTGAKLHRADLLFVAAGAFIVLAAAARLIDHPGYMDAYYYFGGAVQLARGLGFTEPYLWNYLAVGLPGVGPAPPWPSHLYWMPLTSLVAAPAIALAEGVSGSGLEHEALYRAAQWPFVLMACAMPLASYAVAGHLTGRRRHALAAAGLCLFSPFYLAYWSNTDAFALHALTVCGALVAAVRAGDAGPARRGWALAAGACAGLAHLARADGVLVVLVAVGWLLWSRRRAGLALAAITLAGYLVVMAPWLARNVLAVGRPLAGGAQTLWLLDYNDLFNYPADNLTPARYFAAGWGTLLAAKGAALRENLTSLAVTAGGIIAFPFALAGLWLLRRRPFAQIGVAYGLALLALMSLAFSLPGARGGYFHSVAALLPWLTAAAPLGLDAAVETAARRLPHWQPEKSKPVFTALLVAGSVVLAGVVYAMRVIGTNPASTVWHRQSAAYQQAAAWLAQNASTSDVAVVNDPPGWYYWTRQPAIAIPNGEVEVLLRVVDDFDARWVLLDRDHPDGLAALYADPESEPRLALRATFGEAGGPAAYLLERAP